MLQWLQDWLRIPQPIRLNTHQKLDLEGSRLFFWVEKNIWNNISVMFSLDQDETRLVIKHWLEKHHNLEGLSPKPLLGASSPRWQDIVK